MFCDAAGALVVYSAASQNSGLSASDFYARPWAVRLRRERLSTITARSKTPPMIMNLTGSGSESRLSPLKMA